MKTLIVMALVGLVAASGAAAAQDEQHEASRATTVLFNADAPRILDDVVCTTSCQPAHLSCNPAIAQQAGGRCS